MFAETFFLLLFGHAVADFVFQPKAMGLGKNRHNKPLQSDSALKLDINSHKFHPHWYHWLTAHSMVHGGVVYLITGSLILGVIETLLHWLIDFLKCERRISLNQDQVFHIACKFAYCFFI